MKIILFIILIVFFVPISSAFAESMNVGKIYWESEIVSPNSFVKIIVEDNDMNKKEYPNFADNFTIKVWSDSSSDKIELNIVETGVYSGIFAGKIFISDTQSEGKKIFALPADRIYASYTDNTIPQSDIEQEITAAAIVKISGEDMSEHLERIDPSMRKSAPQILIPEWVKSNAGWWSEDAISESEFISGIQFLIKDGIVAVPPTDLPSAEKSDKVPEWVKSNAGWWANGDISESEFISGIQHLIKIGLISISSNSHIETEQLVLDLYVQEEAISSSTDPEIAVLQKELEKCLEITTTYKRLDCEKSAEKKITLHNYKKNAQSFDLGPITYYWLGLGSEGNEFEISSTGQPLLSIRMLAENTRSDITALNCTSPSICSYDVWDGSKSFKYSGMDFTSGQIVLNPGDSKEFNILFGPNIGYGGTKFEYDSSKTYHFRINESFGETSIELDLR